MVAIYRKSVCFVPLNKVFIIIALLLHINACSNMMDTDKNSAGNSLNLQSAVLWINSGESYCYSLSVKLNSSVPNASMMRFSENGLSWSAWTSYNASFSWILSSGSGLKTITGEYRLIDGSSISANTSIYYIEKIVLSDGSAGDLFGSHIAISQDGNRVAAGLPGRQINGKNSAGAIAVFDRDGLSWNCTMITPSNSSEGDAFGFSLAISPDGNLIIAGSPYHSGNTGEVYVFRNQSGVWNEHILPNSCVPGDEIGYSTALYFANSSLIRVASGACMKNNSSLTNRGVVYFWEWDGTAWTVNGSLSMGTEYARFGSSLSFSSDGSTCAIGAPGNANSSNFLAGSVYLYKYTSGWILSQAIDHFISQDQFGDAIALSSNGNSLLAGARLAGTPDFGSAFLFSGGSGSLALQKTFMPIPIPSTDIQFGAAVSISASADDLYFGIPRYKNELDHFIGKVCRQRFVSGAWSEFVITAADASGEDFFGSAIARSEDGHVLAISAPGSTTVTSIRRGGIYIYRE